MSLLNNTSHRLLILQFGAIRFNLIRYDFCPLLPCEYCMLQCCTMWKFYFYNRHSTKFLIQLFYSTNGTWINAHFKSSCKTMNRKEMRKKIYVRAPHNQPAHSDNSISSINIVIAKGKLKDWRKSIEHKHRTRIENNRWQTVENGGREGNGGGLGVHRCEKLT